MQKKKIVWGWRRKKNKEIEMKIKIIFLMVLTAICSFAQITHEKSGIEDFVDEREQLGKIQCV